MQRHVSFRQTWFLVVSDKMNLVVLQVCAVFMNGADRTLEYDCLVMWLFYLSIHRLNVDNYCDDDSIALYFIEVWTFIVVCLVWNNIAWQTLFVLFLYSFLYIPPKATKINKSHSYELWSAHRYGLCHFYCCSATEHNDLNPFYWAQPCVCDFKTMIY